MKERCLILKTKRQAKKKAYSKIEVKIITDTAAQGRLAYRLRKAVKYLFLAPPNRSKRESRNFSV